MFLKSKNVSLKKSLKIKQLISRNKHNIIPASYNNRLLRPRTRLLYFKTVKQQHRFINENVEQGFEHYIFINMVRIEKRHKNKRQRIGLFTPVIPMKFRVRSFTRVFVDHGVKNTFITVFRGTVAEDVNIYKMNVVGKFSCGLTGYTGPKKSTTFARKEVVKDAGNFLSGLLTTLMTVIFTSKVGRWNRKTVRALSPDLAYVVNIITTRTRSHGHQKAKNRRRT